MPIMANSAGPRPKREWSCVDFERVVGLMMDGFWCGDDDGHIVDVVGLMGDRENCCREEVVDDGIMNAVELAMMAITKRRGDASRDFVMMIWC